MRDDGGSLLIVLLMWNVGTEIRDQSADSWKRFVAIVYHDTINEFQFSARRFDDKTSSYICQFHQQGLSVTYIIIKPIPKINMVI